MNQESIKIGVITDTVVHLLGLYTDSGTPIFIGQSNIEHMKNKHPMEYAKYGPFIHEIVSVPDYVGVNPGDGSIEYVKTFSIDNESVKVAVRVSRSGVYFARSLYVLNPERVLRFIENGTLKSLTIE